MLPYRCTVFCAVKKTAGTLLKCNNKDIKGIFSLHVRHMFETSLTVDFNLLQLSCAYKPFLLM